MKRSLNALATAAAALLLGCALKAETTGQTAAPQAPPAAAAPQKKTANLNLAIYIFDGVQIIDYTAPYEVLGQAHVGHEHLFNIYTVAEKEGPITTAMGMTVVPKYTFANMPEADVLLLPGGNVNPHLENPKVIRWVQETAAEAEHVLSVCNGAFYLGKAGLLDGLTATTFYGLIDELRALAPKAKVVTDRRFADNGKIVTTAGLSSGIDGALHLIEKLAGRGKAQEIALNLEYNWQPDVVYARASFADRHLRRVIGRRGFPLPEGTPATVLGQQGGTDRWEKSWEVRTPLAAAELLKIIDAKLAEGWTKVPQSPASSAATDTRWKFTDEEGKTWHARSLVEPAGPGTYKLTIRLARADVAAQAQVN
ncbi:MAG TPA: DJ-1/PfpI family protein [Pyrinomonadaceae bacterium]|nr:DJ-1/PfpI family protein [Pyrinomonadaceae bacterium]